MNKSELIGAMAAASGLSKVDARKALDGFVAAVSKALQDGDKVVMTGFGAFSVATRAARQGVNPSTGRKMTIASRKTVKFKAGADLADRVK